MDICSDIIKDTSCKSAIPVMLARLCRWELVWKASLHTEGGRKEMCSD